MSNLMCYQFIEEDTTLEIHKSGICKCSDFNEGTITNNTFTSATQFAINKDKTVLCEQFIEI